MSLRASAPCARRGIHPAAATGLGGHRRKAKESQCEHTGAFTSLFIAFASSSPASSSRIGHGPHEGTFQGWTMADAQAEKQNRKKKAPKSQMQFSQGFALVLFWHELLRGKLLLPFPLQAGPVPAPGLRHSPGSRCLVGGINLQRVPGDPRHPMAPAAPASTERVPATTGAEGPPEGAEAQRGWWRWGLTPSPPRTVPSICWVKKKKRLCSLENSFSSRIYWHDSKTTHPPAEPWDR